jgi:predicted nucleic-acid-binding protein
VIEGEVDLFVAKTVLLELEWVLRGAYGFARADVLRVLEHLVALPNARVEDRAAVENAIANLRAGFDFADALHHSSGRTCESFLTFDTRRFANRARRMALTPPVRVPA